MLGTFDIYLHERRQNANFLMEAIQRSRFNSNLLNLSTKPNVSRKFRTYGRRLIGLGFIATIQHRSARAVADGQAVR